MAPPPPPERRFYGTRHSRHALHRHGRHAGARRIELRPPVVRALRNHRDRRGDGGAVAGFRNHGPWAEARRRHHHGRRPFWHALHRDAGGHLYRSRHSRPRAVGGPPCSPPPAPPATIEVAHEDATLDRTPLAVGIAGFVLVDLA